MPRAQPPRPARDLLRRHKIRSAISIQISEARGCNALKTNTVEGVGNRYEGTADALKNLDCVKPGRYEIKITIAIEIGQGLYKPISTELLLQDRIGCPITIAEQAIIATTARDHIIAVPAGDRVIPCAGGATRKAAVFCDGIIARGAKNFRHGGGSSR